MLNDPRIKRSKLYPLTEILFVVLCGTICGAESWRDFVLFGKEKTSTERRFFISNLSADAKQIALAVRAHWLIENALHWTLDVVFNEDNSFENIV